MKTKLICWLPTCSYLDASTMVLLKNTKIVPLLDSSYAQDIWEMQGKPYTLRELFYQADTATYKDEPFSVKDGEDSEEWVKQTVAKYPDVTMGESSTEHIEKLIQCGVKNITYTSYGFHLFRLFNKWNIRMPFTSQLRTWEYLEKKYNVRKDLPPYQLYGETLKETVKRVWHENKFNFCWIMLDQTRHFEKLIKWAIQHQKTIGIAVPDKRKNDTEWIYNQLTKFIKVYKEVTE